MRYVLRCSFLAPVEREDEKTNRLDQMFIDHNESFFTQVHTHADIQRAPKSFSLPISIH